MVVAPAHAAAGEVDYGAPLFGLYAGTPEEAWAAAADLSSQVHIVWVDRPYRRVLAVMPAMYDDMWTAAKGMYKMEPAVADGGELIIYAPHIDNISYIHGHLIEQIGYHCRDYILKQWDRFETCRAGSWRIPRTCAASAHTTRRPASKPCASQPRPAMGRSSPRRSAWRRRQRQRMARAGAMTKCS
jgi:hypothetical protein